MKRIVRIVIVVAALSCAVFGAAGCGNVYMKGDALTAAQASAMDAYDASQRATTQPATPAWQRSYLEDNYIQWRAFVRSAVKDTAWGPKLAGE